MLNMLCLLVNRLQRKGRLTAPRLVNGLWHASIVLNTRSKKVFSATGHNTIACLEALHRQVLPRIDIVSLVDAPRIRRF